MCRCLFDITATGVTGHFKSSRVPFLDRTGQQITSETSWNQARNQQRNWETLTQLIGLRTQVDVLTQPDCIDGVWVFEFATETPDAYGPDSDPTLILRTDSAGVPMLNTSIDDKITAGELVVQGPDQNIWFLPVAINNPQG
jgi:hypothetical protein